jgi:hypothetical protein
MPRGGMAHGDGVSRGETCIKGPAIAAPSCTRNGPPEKTIRTLIQFIVMFSAVVLGLLLASALETVPARIQQFYLVSDARRSLQAELTETKSKVIVELAAQHAATKTLEQRIAFAEALRRDRHAPPPADLLPRSFPMLPSTNWDAAVASGAVALMTFREVRFYEAAYQAERAYSAVETEARRSWFGLASFDGDNAGLSDAEILDEERQLRIALAYTANLEASGVGLLQKIEDALNAKRQ